MATTSPQPQTGVPIKATLFCPDCDHRSPVDGDWDVRETTSRRRISCPQCRTTIDTRRPNGRWTDGAAGGVIEPSSTSGQ